MSDKPDWEAIRREYEQGGITLRPLALKYGISKTTLIEKRDKEGWARPTDRPTTNYRPVGSEGITILRTEFPSPASAVRGANLIVDALVEILEDTRKEKTKLEIADYLKVANALSQCNRIIINAPPEEEEEDNLDFSDFTDDELRQYAEFEERARKRA